jgi:hypothetical protein
LKQFGIKYLYKFLKFTLVSGIILPSLIRAANPSSCENAYADRLNERVLALIEERGRVANNVDRDLVVFVP